MIKYIEIFVGAITNANPQDRHNFAFDRVLDTVHLRGPTVSMTIKYNFLLL